jgi:hypothetical protein
LQTYFGPFLSIFGVKSVRLALNWSKISQKGLQGSTKGQNQLKKNKKISKSSKGKSKGSIFAKMALNRLKRAKKG